MCSFSGATCTSLVRHNADYVPYAKIRFDLRQRVASLTLNCNGDFAIRATMMYLKMVKQAISCHK